jgi:pantoate--beta-alanine ligase
MRASIGACQPVQIIRQLSELRTRTRLLREAGQSIALVPTMGALHEGHLALVELAGQQADAVVVSIFVNPRQFGPNEDFDKYPRSEQADALKLAEAGVAVLWMPPVEQVYPPGFATNVSVARLGDGLCGAARPGHFDGVATVVSKLFSQVQPDIAVFGEKDWQQLAIIRRMGTDLDLPVEVIGMPTRRDADGLALSSRNAYLSAEERRAALALPETMFATATAIEGGAEVAQALASAIAKLETAGFASVDYFELVDAASLEPVTRLDCEARLMVAARIGKTRLIDNAPVASKNATRR